LYRHTQLVFSGGLALLAAQRVDGTGTEQKGGPLLGRAMAWPWPLAWKVRSGALGGRGRKYAGEKGGGEGASAASDVQLGSCTARKMKYTALCLQFQVNPRGDVPSASWNRWP